MHKLASQEWCLKLRKLGFSQPAQTTWSIPFYGKVETISTLANRSFAARDDEEFCPAWDAVELMNALPSTIIDEAGNKNVLIVIKNSNTAYDAGYCCKDVSISTNNIWSRETTLPDALAQLLCCVLENGQVAMKKQI